MKSCGESPVADRWMIRGTEFTNCNCAWGCPCLFGAKSTHGHCEEVLCGHIDEGNLNDTNLDGLVRCDRRKEVPGCQTPQDPIIARVLQ